MARAVYSTRFLDIEGASSPTATYTVPPGFVAVVRDVTASVIGADGSGLSSRTVDPAFYLWIWEPASGVTAAMSQSMRVVLNAGEQLRADGLTAAFSSVAISGYLLGV